MMTMVVVSGLVACGSSAKPAPSCNQAISAYYAAGCAFRDLDTGQNVPRDQVIAECQSGAGSTPPACQDEEDDLLVCLSESTPAMQCDCSEEQMTLIRCG